MKLRLIKAFNGLPPGFIMKNAYRGVGQQLIARGIAVEIIEDNEDKKCSKTGPSRRTRQSSR
jgi:hypothetical protein